ncbi:hypothetical protein [Peptostreptococcus porci]|uniref:hypothetical protein n=1 Tax=Peptostreptococcus porci TaxID=2652282 RepID=UPI002A913F04|nr:hypothetical protein [Peptostreptococcus porci]MDY5436147.1 hypothetical protein [Peptostreptococcus porci]
MDKVFLKELFLIVIFLNIVILIVNKIILKEKKINNVINIAIKIIALALVCVYAYFRLMK